MNDIVPLTETATTQLYQMADLAFFPAGNDQTLVYSRNSQVARFLRTEVSALLQHCREFKTIDEHIRTYYSGQQMSVAAISMHRRELLRLVHNGYLISESSIQSIFQKLDEPTVPGSIASIGFPTSSRVETLQRSMISYIESCQRFSRNNDFIVMDDSITPATRSAYRKMLHILKSLYGVNIAYAGFEEKTAFVKKLTEAGSIPADIASFACLGDKQYGITTIGANRNALLLHTVGDMIFSSDDDIVCQVAASPTLKEGLTLTSRGDPLEVWFFPDREAALRSADFVEQDVLALHEQWLGKDQKSWRAIDNEGANILFKSIEPDLVRRLTKRPGKVALTLNGTIGDCGWDNPYYYLFQDGETFRRLTSSEQAYQSFRTSREVVQVAQQVTITEKADSLFGMCMGLDNRELLPPFTPIGRAEDVAFGMMLSKCFSATYIVHLPWILLHAPLNARTYSAQPLFSIGFNSWISSCISLFDPGFARTPSERLHKLGQHLKEIGHLPKATFEEFVRQHMWQSATALISGLEERIQMSKESIPEFWLQDIKGFIAEVRQNALLPSDQLYALCGGREVIQSLLIQFGQVLEWWPIIVTTAKYLRAEGYRLAQPI